MLEWLGLWTIKSTFAGLWPMVWHWGTPIAVIILCGLAEIALEWGKTIIPFIGALTEPITKRVQEILLAVMIGAGLFLWGLGDGVKVEHAHAVAQQKVLMDQVNSVVGDVLSNIKPDTTPLKKGQKRKAPADRWDNPEN